MTQSTLPSLSDLIPTWSCLSYRLSQAFTGAFFYGFSIQQTFLFPGWADPTTACLATDGSSSPTAAPTWRGRRPESIRGIHSHKRSLSLRTVCLAGEPPASSKCLKSLMNRDNSLQGLLKIPYKFGLFWWGGLKCLIITKKVWPKAYALFVENLKARCFN